MLTDAFKERLIEVDRVRSLAWDGDFLVDWVIGGRRYGLDGSFEDRSVNYAYPFDASVVSPSGEYAAIFKSDATKGLLLRNGEILRQLNRDFYCANAYTHPITFARLDDGREILIHCPEQYCRIEIEDVETGERLTENDQRKCPDIFHSRLSVSPDAKWLMSSGWVWAPIDVVYLFDLREALQNPEALDCTDLSPPGSWEMSSAAFVDSETVAIGTSNEFYGDDDESENQPGKHRVAIWSLGAPSYSAAVALGHPPGTIMPISNRFVVSMYEHPRLVDVHRGATVHEWSDIDSGKQTGSITWSNLPPPIALDATNARFAVADVNTIRVVEIDVKAIE